MAKEIDQAQAAALWNLFGVTVDKVRIAPRQHKGNVVFAGYADIHIWLFSDQTPIPFLTLSGNSIKLIGDKIHFDPKSERGKGDRSNDFFPHWAPKGSPARAVLTAKLSEDPSILEMIQVAVARLASASDAVN